MATPNYQYAKRQKEIAKKKKQDEKQKRRLAKNDSGATEVNTPPADADKK